VRLAQIFWKLRMRILDLSAGKRMIWFDKNPNDVVFVDIRYSVSPSVVADTRRLPFSDCSFDLVVFDPPHVNFGVNSNFSRDYGHHTTQEIQDIVTHTAHEAYRVSTYDALMAFKWNDHDQKFGSILSLMWQWWIPLFGHRVSSRTKHSSTTGWVLLRRSRGVQPE
jgi:hypothetical protein